MAWIERFTCDVCNKQMGEKEKWWMAMNECASSVDTKSGQPTLKFMPWDNAFAHSAESKHLCGAGCAHTFMDRWMADFRAGTENCVDGATTS